MCKKKPILHVFVLQAPRWHALKHFGLNTTTLNISSLTNVGSIEAAISSPVVSITQVIQFIKKSVTLL